MPKKNIFEGRDYTNFVRCYSNHCEGGHLGNETPFLRYKRMRGIWKRLPKSNRQLYMDMR